MAAALAFAFVLPTIAAATGTHKSTPHVSGTIASWDDATKLGTVKVSAGKETSFGWDENTTVSGTPKVGEHLRRPAALRDLATDAHPKPRGPIGRGHVVDVEADDLG